MDFALDDSSRLIDDSYAYDKYDNRFNGENNTADDYEDELTSVYEQELASNRRVKKACKDILHVLEEDGRHRVILNELNYNVQEFYRLKDRYYDQDIYREMYVLAVELRHDYKEHYSIETMVKKVNKMQEKINKNISEVNALQSEYQHKHALKNMTHVDHNANMMYERPSRRPFFL